MYASTDQVMDPRNPLRNIDGTQCHSLVEFSRTYECYYTRAIKIVYLYTAVNPDGATYSSSVYYIPGQKLLKMEYCTVTLNEQRRCNFSKTVINEYGAGFTADPLRILYAFWLERKAISPAQAIELRRIAIIPTATARRLASFTNTSQRSLS